MEFLKFLDTIFGIALGGATVIVSIVAICATTLHCFGVI